MKMMPGVNVGSCVSVFMVHTGITVRTQWKEVEIIGIVFQPRVPWIILRHTMGTAGRERRVNTFKQQMVDDLDFTGQIRNSCFTLFQVCVLN